MTPNDVTLYARVRIEIGETIFPPLHKSCGDFSEEQLAVLLSAVSRRIELAWSHMASRQEQEPVE